MPLTAGTAHEAVTQLAQRLIDTGAVARPERLARLFAEPRLRDLIHVGERVILPHLRTEAVDELVVAVGISPEPLRVVEGRDAGEALVVIFVLAPPGAAGLYLQAVAAIARALRDDAVVDALLSAHTPAEVLAIPAVQGITIQPRLLVRDLMTQRVYRVSPDDTVEEVLQLVKQHHLRAIPVVDEERSVLGTCYGISSRLCSVRGTIPRVPCGPSGSAT